MTMKTTITNFKQLIEYIRTNKLNVGQSSELIAQSLRVWVNTKDYKNTEELIEDIETYWKEWKNIKERPLFLDLDKFEIGMIYNEDSDFYSKMTVKR